MNNVEHCIGVLSYCDSEKTPDRYKRLKESVLSMSALKNSKNYMFLWDNGSSNDVKQFLSERSFFDDIFFSDKNLMDNGPITLLNMKAKELGAEFVTFLCDDSLVYDEKAIPHCFDFLRSNNDVGYVRVLKYEIDKWFNYDKIHKNPQTDIANAQRHYNNISGEPLSWEGVWSLGGYNFYKNNWHWTEFPNVCKANVLDKIIPKEDCGPMQVLEGTMMKNYHQLGLKTGVLDMGAITHNQRDFHGGGSLRVSEVCNTSLSEMIIKYDEMVEKIEEVVSSVK